MYVTPLNFEQVLDRFYNQIKYELMLLFVSSFDGNDRSILKGIVDNAKRIDRITGNRICFFYFIKDSYDSMNESLTRWVKDISEWEPLYGEGVNVTMETADDICRHFGILRSNLPAFILVGKDRQEEPLIFSIHDYHDLESFLTPLNILHSYIEDKESILFRYQQDLQKYQNQIKRREKWTNTLRELEAKREEIVVLGMAEQTKDCNLGIEKLRERLRESPLQPSEDNKERDLILLENKTIDRLNMSLNSQTGKSIVEQIQYRYASVVLEIFNSVGTRGIRLSNILSRIRTEIYEHGFDVFISCKSQDYALAHELYDYLVYNGFKPFLADTSIKEVGIDQYTALIGEVINVCQNMIVFATNSDYIETPYVAAEWHTFVNDINTGHKPNAKLVNILAPNIDINNLPSWLRDKQYFTTENYKDGLIHFLHNRDNKIAERLLDEVNKVYSRIRDNVDQLLRHYRGGEVEYMVYRFKDNVEKDYRQIVSRLDRFRIYGNDSYDINRLELDELSAKSKHAYEEWEDRLRHLTQDVEQYIENDEGAWCKAIHYNSAESLESYLKQFPYGRHSLEATERFHYVQNKCERNKIANQDEKESINPSVSFLPIDISKQTSTCYIYASLWDRLFGRKTFNVYSSIFAPAEVKRKFHMQVQVYLHLFGETEKVKTLAQESDKNAKRRDYIPLQCKLKKGDKVDVLLNIYGETLLMSDKKRVVWQGSFTKCSFDYFVPKDIDVDELSCLAKLFVNGAMIGEMRFLTQIVENPRNLNPEILPKSFKKIFISYAHKDFDKVKFMAKAYNAQGVDYFFDRDYLKAGDIYPKKIKDYIDTSDLFILCWSENAAKSEYVEKEKSQALSLSKNIDENKGTLTIHPLSIEPRAELPSDMKDDYNFEVI